MCNATNHKSFGSVLTVANKVCWSISYIFDNMIVFYCQWLCDILCMVLSFHTLVYMLYLIYILMSVSKVIAIGFNTMP